MEAIAQAVAAKAAMNLDAPFMEKLKGDATTKHIMSNVGFTKGARIHPTPFAAGVRRSQCDVLHHALPPIPESMRRGCMDGYAATLDTCVSKNTPYAQHGIIFGARAKKDSIRLMSCTFASYHPHTHAEFTIRLLVDKDGAALTGDRPTADCVSDMANWLQMGTHTAAVQADKDEEFMFHEPIEISAKQTVWLCLHTATDAYVRFSKANPVSPEDEYLKLEPGPFVLSADGLNGVNKTAEFCLPLGTVSYIVLKPPPLTHLAELPCSSFMEPDTRSATTRGPPVYTSARAAPRKVTTMASDAHACVCTEVSLSVFREFLARKSLHDTLVCLDREAPRGPDSISSRTVLVKTLNIKKHMRRAKSQADHDGVPLATILEVIADYWMAKASVTPSGAAHTRVRTEMSLSVFREFLARKSLHDTLACLDREAPRGPDSISSRNVLVETLNITKHTRRAKAQADHDGVPLATVLEVMADYWMAKANVTTTQANADTRARDVLSQPHCAGGDQAAPSATRDKAGSKHQAPPSNKLEGGGDATDTEDHAGKTVTEAKLKSGPARMAARDAAEPTPPDGAVPALSLVASDGGDHAGTHAKKAILETKPPMADIQRSSTKPLAVVAANGGGSAQVPSIPLPRPPRVATVPQTLQQKDRVFAESFQKWLVAKKQGQPTHFGDSNEARILREKHHSLGYPLGKYQLAARLREVTAADVRSGVNLHHDSAPAPASMETSVQKPEYYGGDRLKVYVEVGARATAADLPAMNAYEIRFLVSVDVTTCTVSTQKKKGCRTEKEELTTEMMTSNVWCCPNMDDGTPVAENALTLEGNVFEQHSSTGSVDRFLLELTLGEMHQREHELAPICPDSTLHSPFPPPLPPPLLPGSGTGVHQGDLQVEAKAVETAPPRRCPPPPRPRRPRPGSATETAAAVEEIAGFVVGMRLEAVDRQNLSLTAVANIAEIRANTDGTTSLKINFDGWSDTYDYWALSDSSDLFPVGYCEWESLKLQAPKGFDGDFKWQSYLSSTGTVAVPEDLLPGSGTGARLGPLFKADATPKVDMPKVKKVPPPVAKNSLQMHAPFPRGCNLLLPLGQRAMLPDGRGAATVVSATNAGYTFRQDNSTGPLHDHSVESSLYLLPTLQYENGQSIVVFTGGGAWQEATVLQHLGGSQHRVSLNQTSADLHLELDLNRTNHYLPRMSASEFASARAKHLLGVVEGNATVKDSITKLEMHIESQTVHIKLSEIGEAAKKGQWASVNDVVDLTQRLVQPCQTREEGWDGNNWPMLIKAKAGAGKTWLTRQMLRKVCGMAKVCEHVPLLVPVQRLVYMMRLHGVGSNAMPSRGRSNSIAGTAVPTNMIELFLHETYADDEPETLQMCLDAFDSRRLFIIIDGIDEASDLRADIKHFLRDVLLARGHRVLVTSRPEGVSDDTFYSSNFVMFDMLPYTSDQQRQVMDKHLKGTPTADFFTNLLLYIDAQQQCDAAYLKHGPTGKLEKAQEVQDKDEIKDGGFQDEFKQTVGALEPTASSLAEFAAAAKPAFEAALEACASQIDDAALEIGPVKLAERIQEKATDSYHPEVEAGRRSGPAAMWVHDVLRCKFICGSETAVLQVMQGMQSSSAFRIVRRKNFFKTLTTTHLRRIALTVQFVVPPGGLRDHEVMHYCEVQIHLQHIYTVSNENNHHAPYEYFRRLFGKEKLKQQLDTKRGGWMAIENQIQLWASFAKEPVLFSLFILILQRMGGKPDINHLPQSQTGLYRAAVAIHIQDSAQRTAGDVDALYRTLQIVAYSNHLQPNGKFRREFDLRHVGEALEEHAELNTLFRKHLESNKEMPTLKVIDDVVASSTADGVRFQSLHLSIQEFMCVELLHSQLAAINNSEPNNSTGGQLPPFSANLPFDPASTGSFLVSLTKDTPLKNMLRLAKDIGVGAQLCMANGGRVSFAGLGLANGTWLNVLTTCAYKLHCEHITTLELSGIDTHGTLGDVFGDACTASRDLRRLVNLVSLNFSNNDLCGAIVPAVPSFVQAMPRLKDFNLQGNPKLIRDHMGATELAVVGKAFVYDFSTDPRLQGATGSESPATARIPPAQDAAYIALVPGCTTVRWRRSATNRAADVEQTLERCLHDATADTDTTLKNMNKPETQDTPTSSSRGTAHPVSEKENTSLPALPKMLSRKLPALAVKNIEWHADVASHSFDVVLLNDWSGHAPNASGSSCSIIMASAGCPVFSVNVVVAYGSKWVDEGSGSDNDWSFHTAKHWTFESNPVWHFGEEAADEQSTGQKVCFQRWSKELTQMVQCKQEITHVPVGELSVLRLARVKEVLQFQQLHLCSEDDAVLCCYGRTSMSETGLDQDAALMDSKLPRCRKLLSASQQTNKARVPLPTSTTLTGLRCFGTDGWFATVGASGDISMNTNEVSLSLQPNSLGPEGAAALSEAIKVNSTLTTMNLHGNKIRPDAPCAQPRQQPRPPRPRPQLSRQRPLEPPSQPFFSSEQPPRQGPRLRPLPLQLLRSLPQSRRLLPPPPPLQLVTNGWSPAALSEALKVNSTLTTINLEQNSIGPEGAAALSEALKVNSTLTTINLYGNSIGHEGAAALSKALKANSTLTTMDLRGNTCGLEASVALLKWAGAKPGRTVQLDDLDKIHQLVLAEGGDDGVATLHLSSCKLVDGDAKWLGTLLTSNTVITRLSLYGNSIGSEGVAALSKALKVNSTLTTMDLHSNLIGPKGAAALLEALKVNSTLTTMNLNWNSIGPDGAAALSEALKVNSTLTATGLQQNPIGPEGAAALSEALKVNSTPKALPSKWHTAFQILQERRMCLVEGDDSLLATMQDDSAA